MECVLSWQAVFKLLKSHKTFSAEHFLEETSTYVKQTEVGCGSTEPCWFSVPRGPWGRPGGS